MEFPPQGNPRIICTSFVWILKDYGVYKRTEDLPQQTILKKVWKESLNWFICDESWPTKSRYMIHTFANVLCGSFKTGGEKRGGSLNLVLEACQSGPSISKRGIMAHKDRRKDKATKLVYKNWQAWIKQRLLGHGLVTQVPQVEIWTLVVTLDNLNRRERLDSIHTI